MRGSFLFLGTGGSAGVPVLTCRCPVCVSPSPLNKRKRAAALIRVEGKTVLIDAGPDIRDQLLRAQVVNLSGAMITHSHYDHIAGLDELRLFFLIHKIPLPILCSADSYGELAQRFSYLLHTQRAEGVQGALFTFEMLEGEMGDINFQGIPIQFVTYLQAGMRVNGYRFGDLAYISDIRDYEEQIIERLRGVKTLVVSALRHAASKVHFSIDEAIQFSRRIGAERTFLTHIAHDLDHEKTNRALPDDVRLAYDEMELNFNL